MQLVDLGDDILKTILFYLEPKDWCAAQVVCQKWRKLCLEKSFNSSYKFHAQRSDAEWDKLMKSLSRKFIFKLDLSSSNCLGDYNRVFPKCNLLVKDLILNQCFSSHKLYFSITNSFKTNFLKSRLPCLIGLKSLEWQDYSIDDSWIEGHYHYPFNTRLVFKNLQDLKIGYYGTSPLDHVLEIFPSLRALHLNFLASMDQKNRNFRFKAYLDKTGISHLIEIRPDLKITYSRPVDDVVHWISPQKGKLKKELS